MRGSIGHLAFEARADGEEVVLNCLLFLETLCTLRFSHEKRVTARPSRSMLVSRRSLAYLLLVSGPKPAPPTTMFRAASLCFSHMQLRTYRIRAAHQRDGMWNIDAPRAPPTGPVVSYGVSRETMCLCKPVMCKGV